MNMHSKDAADSSAAPSCATSAALPAPLAPWLDLKALLRFERIAVQVPDTPHVDALAAAWGLFRFFQSAGGKGKRLLLFHLGGEEDLSPPVRELLAQLDIPLRHQAAPFAWDGLCVTVGKATPVQCREHVLIDTCQPCGAPPPLHDVRPYLGSRSTLVWMLLRQAGFAVDKPLGTALYYGLYRETDAFRGVRFPLDLDMRDALPVEKRLFEALDRAKLSIGDLAVTAQALGSLDYHAEERFVLVNVLPCDVRMLDFIGDLAMRVSSVDCAVVFSETSRGLRFCVRSAVREVQALDLGRWLAAPEEDVAGGRDRAGGVIAGCPHDNEDGGLRAAEFFLRRLRAYLTAYDVADCATAKSLSALGARSFQKLPVTQAYVRSTDCAPVGATLHIRMLEGDLFVPVAADLLLVIGLKGEVYPMRESVFARKYMASHERAGEEYAYPPVVLTAEGERIALHSLALACASREERVLALPLQRGLKLFTLWDRESYMLGQPGDWLVQTKNALHDQYIVTKDLFPHLYRAVKPGDEQS